MSDLISYGDFMTGGAAAAPNGPIDEFRAVKAGKAAAKAQSPISYDAFMGNKAGMTEAPQSLGDKALEIGKKGLANIGAAADLIAGVGGQAIDIGVHMGARAVGAVFSPLTGETDAEGAASAAAIKNKVATSPYNFLAAPVQKAMAAFGFGPDYNESEVNQVMGKIGGWLDEKEEYIQEQTGGRLRKEDLANLVDIGMLKGGVEGANLAVREKFKAPVGRDAAVQAKKFPLGPQAEETPLAPMTAEEILSAQTKGPVLTAQEHIDKSLGIKNPKEREAYMRARGKDVRAAFKDDAEYADYLKYKTDEQVLRSEQYLAEQEENARKMQESLDKIQDSIPTPDKVKMTEGKVLGEQPRPIDSAVDKVREGRGFALTAEEKIAYREATKPGGAGLVDKYGKPLALGAGVVALSQVDSDKAKEFGALGAAIFVTRGHMAEEGALASPHSPLGVAMKGSHYTFKSIERLDPNMHTIPKARLEQELARADITQVEKDFIHGIMGATPDESISAVEMVKAIKRATGDFELTPEETHEHADYGLDRLDRDGGEQQPPATTTLWKLPDHMDPGPIERQLPPTGTGGLLDIYGTASNIDHFYSNVMGFTRSFVENGIRHIVEIQSDLSHALQGAGKITHESLKTMREVFRKDVADLFQMKKDWDEIKKATILRAGGDAETVRLATRAVRQEMLAKLRERFPDVWLADHDVLSEHFESVKQELTDKFSKIQKELNRKLANENLNPLMKEWWKRLIREEVARAETHDGIELRKVTDEYEKRIRTIKHWEEALSNAIKANEAEEFIKDLSNEVQHNKTQLAFIEAKLRRAQKKAESVPNSTVVRFPTAETVAKVENWPRKDQSWIKDYTRFKEELEDTLHSLQRVEKILAAEGTLAEDIDFLNKHRDKLINKLERIKENLKTLEDAKTASAGKFEHPGHQSIYDKYAKDISKFLTKEFKAEPVTDALGHTWLEVRNTKPWAGKPRLMAGNADPRLLARMSLLGGGVAAGMALDKDNKILGGLLGGLGAVAAMRVNPVAAARAVKEAFKPDNRIRVDGLADAHEVALARGARAIASIQYQIEKLVPKADRRAAVTHAIESGSMAGLTADEIKAAKLASSLFAEIAKQGLDGGVLKNALDNYVTHLWGTDEKTQGILEALFAEKPGGPSMSPESRFALRRSIPTLAEGKAKGMTPLTEDISQILGIYGNSMMRSLENKRMLTALRNETVPGTAQKLVMPAAKAPAGYVPIQHPQMAGMLVHPDIAQSLRFIFDNRAPGPIMRGLEAVNTLTKRMAVSFSLFHAKALGDALIGATLNPITVGKTFVTSAFGANKFLKMVKEGGAGDLVDTALLGGLKFEMQRGAGLDELHGTFYTALSELQKHLDATVPHLGLPVKGFIAINHAVDKVMWSNLHAGMKLSVFAEKYAKLMQMNAEAAAKNPMVKLKSKEEIAKIAASFTNDIFGGLNWRRAAESVKTRWGRDIALNAASPTGRRVMQIALFAPDWTVSTARAVTQAFGKGTGLKGLIKPQELADLHRQYIIRSAIYYMTVADAINYSMSGHHFWQNKDPTSIDLGDGRTMQWSKHIMESVHWMTKPGQQVLNKLGYVPRELLNQVEGTEYLSTSGHAPRMGNRVLHAMKGFSPISVQQGFQAGHGSGIAGWLGAPIYGRTYKERAEAAEAQKEKNRQEAPERRLKALEKRLAR